MSINNRFVQDIKDYMLIDNKINEINTFLKKQKEKRNIIEKEIINYVNKNNLNKNKFNLNNTTISVAKQINTPTISLKLLKEVLEETVENKDFIELLLNNIYKKREKLSKINYSLKIKKK